MLAYRDESYEDDGKVKIETGSLLKTISVPGIFVMCKFYS